MRQKYFIKATLSGRRANYDDSIYQMGNNLHPDPDLSNVACGRGYHLARTLADALFFVPQAAEFYLVTPGKILGQDKSKIRTDSCTLLWQIPQPIIADYQAKRKSLYDDYEAKRKSLDDDYEAKRKSLYDDYWAKRKLLGADYEVRLKLLDADYEVRLKLLDADYQAKLKLLGADYQAKRKPLYGYYWAKLKLLDDDYKAKCKPLGARFMRKIIRKWKVQAKP